MSMNELVGKTIAGVRISADRNKVMFDVHGGPPVTFVAKGDCCSESWIEDFDHETVIGGTVLRVEEKTVGHDGLVSTKYPDNQQEVDKQNFYEIITDKGSATLEMRNSSNGYYGGWMEFDGGEARSWW